MSGRTSGRAAPERKVAAPGARTAERVRPAATLGRRAAERAPAVVMPRSGRASPIREIAAPSSGSLARVQKVLAARGVASRRKAETLVAQGRVRVDGEVVRELGVRVAPRASIEVDGRRVAPPASSRYVLLNKPRGVIATARDERGRPTVVGMIGARERLYPVGRLDADSEGLLLLTNDGAWAERVLHPRYGHEREYEAFVAGEAGAAAVAALLKGVQLEEGLARADRARLIRRSQRGGVLRIVISTGWKRQVRRMCAGAGLQVVRLRRVRLGPLVLGNVAPGAWRELTPREVRALAEAPVATDPRALSRTRAAHSTSAGRHARSSTHGAAAKSARARARGA